MVAIGNEGGIDNAAALLGDWGDVDFLTTTGYRYNIGNVKEGVLEITRETFSHVSTAFPRVVDYVVPTRAGMRFTGQAEEPHKALFHALLGDAIDTASNYIYPGTQQCNVFFTLHIRRKRACDDVVIEAKLFKVQATGLVSVAGGDETVGIPMELEGLDDRANDMGQGGSAAAPIGYIWLPNPGSNVEQYPGG